MTYWKRYARLLPWLIPAVAAFWNALVLKVHDRPPLTLTVPLKGTDDSPLGSFLPPEQGPVKSFRYEAFGHFTNHEPAQVEVSIRTGFLEFAPPVWVHVLRDGAPYASFEPVSLRQGITLQKGTHDYVVSVYGRQESTRMLSSEARLVARVVYPGTATTQQLLCLLGLGFFGIAALQLRRVGR